MAELNTQGFEFFGEDEQRFRMMLIERVEAYMVHNQITKSALADKAGIGKTAFYSKMDRAQSSQFTVSDLFRMGKVLDVSILQFFPVDEIDRQQGGQIAVPASVLKLMDEMMSMPSQDIELLHSLMQTLRQHKRLS
ncbi:MULTISPECIES: XRE family transcriptional regulator [unclassified Agarivorans]|uniref:XRE family transcriptional regulator n=1 Tax=unclassified Agarivorans TaxID=2636026 RepID=UPI0026E15FD9|nr:MULTISPECIES: XRE family transcriptional regulator [unclassified Agarivorans]MDO6683855.1 XRE family transcriptional regulator [Agarivorans sp. 3_MG-2023]MDO6714412.1 XRE family transcriptional regulator [Agarivorans sp. 2_MG-2023]